MSGDMHTPEEVFSWVESFTNLERGNLPFDKRNYRLDRMRRLLGLFDDPDEGLRIIHVAGTKGKGSTSALLASVLRAAGHITGLYTSPHVASAFERIGIAGEPPRPALLVRLGGEVKRVMESLPQGGIPGHYDPTTFEL
jgi:dihydrofolate synthase / folylpolyglutamate synthase